MNNARKTMQIENDAVQIPARIVRWMLPALLCLLASACATTGGPGGEAYNETQAGTTACTPGNKSQTSNSGQANGKQQPCVHKGPIEISENYPVSPEVKTDFKQAVTLLKVGNYTDAIRMLKTVTAKTDKFSGPFIDLGIAYAQTKEYKKSEKSLKKALAIHPMHPAALNELGIVYRKTGRYGEARKIYEKLLYTYPNYMPAHKNLGVLCDIYLQDLSCALNQYKTYLKARPDDKKVKIWVADVKRRM
ncbi:MAG: tetratricopeptide repeat protein [Gammaproteobacteria bacterium]